MTPQLLRDLLTEAEEMAERHADDVYTCKQMGSFDSALQARKHERSTRSLIRLARKELVKLESESGT